MPEDKHPGVMAINAHEDFLEHVERGSSKIRFLSRVTVLVASLLTISYLLQLVVLPFVLGVRAQTVDLVDPTLMAFEAGSASSDARLVVCGRERLPFYHEARQANQGNPGTARSDAEENNRNLALVGENQQDA